MGTENGVRLSISNPTWSDLLPPLRLYYINQPNWQASVPMPETTGETV